MHQDREIIMIDGSFGEGGGQILRTSLSLAAVTGRPVRIERIRAGRGRPGLLRQHLTGLRALADITGATVEGGDLGSTALTFAPGPVRPGTYRFAVGSAGSANLVLQTVLPPLMRADGPSTVTVEGGTHNDASPPAHYLAEVFLPLLARFGPRVGLTLDRWGFYPAGGGSVTGTIEPGRADGPFELLTRGSVELDGFAARSNLPKAVVDRELAVFAEAFELPRERLTALDVPGPGPGNVCWVRARCDGLTEMFTGFGRKGAPAEVVAGDVVREVRTWLAHGAPVGEHLADQLLIPLALAGEGRFRTGPPSLHTLTNIAVIERFLPVRFVSSQDGDSWWLEARSGG